MTCNAPFEVIKQHSGPKQKRFCNEACNIAWWNEQPQHPVIPKVDASHPRALELKQKRTQLVLLEKADPYTYGYIPDHWEVANAEYGATQELLISGGNRAGKTLWAARRVVQTLLEKENASVLCCHTSHATSVTVQQPAIYNYLPVALRATKKGRIHYLNYSRKNGFTDGSFILPNGSRCDFLNYTGDACVFYCELYADKDDKVPVATGYAEEIKSDRGVNATSFVENCETSAIGRAIANCPLQAPASGPRPSRNEMQKVERLGGAPQPSGQVHTPSGAFATPNVT